MKKTYALLIFLMFAFRTSYAQTTTIIGVMSVYNALGGLGCDASCDEGSYYSSYAPYTFCSTGSAVAAGGATEQPMWISFYIPNACNVTVTGEYGAPWREHSVCSDSRMDSGDLLGIANTTVSNASISADAVTNVGTCNTISGSGSSTAAGCTGSGNTDEGVSYTTSGPVTVSVYGHANRSDEVITYTVTGTGSSCSTIGVVVLPIELMGFAAYKATANDINLMWTTVTETNNDYFTLEYSLDAVNFIPYAKIKGAGNSFEKKQYNYTFNQDIGKATPYFRLKQVDYNGKFSYSPIITAGTSAGFSVSVSPLAAYYNNDLEKITAKFKLDYPQEVSLTLYDITGQEIYTDHAVYNEGDNTVLISSPPMEGAYFLVYQSGASSPIRKKVLVVK